MLNEMRLGKMTPESANAFRKLSRPLATQDDFVATELSVHHVFIAFDVTDSQ